APDAKFYLFISEIAETETVLEETLWVEAAERADSLGVNVINTSLGYTTYDNPNHSHSYSDMDGKTTFISRGAEIAASRGMLLVNSVGNSGNSDWKYMGAPADAPSVIAVGAVDASGNIASFSSFGPTSDGRIKPEILAQGANSAIINFSTGERSTSNGTSFSSPIMAGLIACLNDELGMFVKSLGGKRKNNTENRTAVLKQAIYESSDKHNNPIPQYGYGIPNFELAYGLYLDQIASVEDFSLSSLKINPNPIISDFSITNLNGDLSSVSIKIFNILGKEVFKIAKMTSNNIDISSFKSGVYILKIQKENQQRTLKLIKE
ncbi:MAG: S8/S53 family peptidase, partial [Polaribacter sp.]